MVFYVDPYSSSSGVMSVMDRMQKEMEYRFRKMERDLYYQRPMYAPQVVDFSPPKENPEIKKKAEKLRNLIAFYYHR